MNAPPPQAGPSGPVALPESVKAGLNATGNYVDSLKSTVSDSFNEFSKQAEVGSAATTQYLSSNTAVAKFAFLILVLIVFVFLIGLGISLVSYFTSPNSNPYLISGMIDGASPITISQDPKKDKNIPILRSNNQQTGLEFTWSVWLFINDLGNDTSKYQHIFNKGDNNFDPVTNLSMVNNAPGLYLSPATNQLHVVMDTINSSDSNTVIDISNIPIRKWVHVAVRIQNTILDVYVNGTISGRLIMQNVPKQNYNDVNICQNGGFSGKLADLRYFSRALNVFDINSIVAWGPNTSTSSASTLDQKVKGNYSYLSSIWYNSRL
jgi:hypothetical protein